MQLPYIIIKRVMLQQNWQTWSKNCVYATTNFDENKGILMHLVCILHVIQAPLIINDCLLPNDS